MASSIFIWPGFGSSSGGNVTFLGTVSAPIFLAGDGSATVAAFGFTSNTAKGMRVGGSTGVDIGQGAGTFVRVGEGSQASYGVVVNAAGHFGWNSGNVAPGTDATPDLLLFRDAANTLAQRNGTNAQAFRIYKNTTGSVYGALDYTGTRLLFDTSTNTGITIGGNSSTVSFNASILLGGGQVLMFSPTAPTIASGFGASPSIASSNGTAAFTVNVGTGGSASSGVITLPAATTGWVLSCVDITNAATSVTVQTAGTTTSATIANYSRTTGLLTAWAASDVIRISAMAY